MTDTQSTVDDFLAARDRQPAAAAPSSIADIWNANWDAAGLSTLGAGKSFGDARSDIVSGIEGAAGMPLGQYARSQGLPLGAAGNPDDNIRELADIAGTLPPDKQKLIEPLLDWRKRAEEKASALERNAADVNASAYGLSANAVRLAAGIARQAVDPLNIAAMAVTAPIGGEAALPLWQVFARQALAAGAAQVLQEPTIQATRGELGLEHGFGVAGEDVIGAAGAGGIMGGGLATLLRGGAAALRLIRKPATEAPAPAAVTTELPKAAAGPSAPAPIARAADQAIEPWAMRAGIESILAAQRVAPDVEQAGRGLSARLQQEAGGFSVPVMDEGAIRRISEEAQLHARDADIAARLETLPKGDAAAAAKLARLSGIEEELAQATDEPARKALQDRRDELLTDTNPDKLRAAAAPIEQRRALTAEQASIADRLKAIAGERAKLTPEAAPPNFWQRHRVPQALYDVPLAAEDLDAAARHVESGQVVDALAPERSATGRAAHAATLESTTKSLETGRPIIETGPALEPPIAPAAAPAREPAISDLPLPAEAIAKPAELPAKPAKAAAGGAAPFQGMIENAEAYRAAAKKRREASGGAGAVTVHPSAAARDRARGLSVPEARARHAEAGASFDAMLAKHDIQGVDVPNEVRADAIDAMLNRGFAEDPSGALDYAMARAERDALADVDSVLAGEALDGLNAARYVLETEGSHDLHDEIPFGTGEGAAGAGGEVAGQEGGAAAPGDLAPQDSPGPGARRASEPGLIAEREAQGQQVLPGAERISEAELAQRRADQALKPKVPQKPMDTGLFGDEAKQLELGDRSLAADAERVLEEAGGDFKIVLDEAAGEVSAREALAEAEDDAAAARALEECAAMDPGENE